MEFEHFGINVPDSTAMANWYVKHCDMQIIRYVKPASEAYFIADKNGRLMLEIYSNSADTIVDHFTQHPLRFHFAFSVADPDSTREKLLAAGASLVEELKFDDGTHLVMMRDPWGVPVQLCKRAEPMI